MVDSRLIENDTQVKRRRKCVDCEQRWITIEAIEYPISITICPKCSPEEITLLYLVPEMPGYVFCEIHGQMKWPIEIET